MDRCVFLRVAHLWTLTNDRRVATCVVVEHSLGFEARYCIDGEFVRSKVARDIGALATDVNDARAELEALGWTSEDRQKEAS